MISAVNVNWVSQDHSVRLKVSAELCRRKVKMSLKLGWKYKQTSNVRPNIPQNSGLKTFDSSFTTL